MPFEEPCPGVAVHHLRELVDRLALAFVELRRQVDYEAIMDVASTVAAEARRPLAAEPLDGAVRRPRRHAESLAPIERRNLDLGALQSLGNRQRHLDLDVVALADEDRRRR